MLHKEALTLFEQVMKLNYKPNEWELNFIQSILHRDPNIPLTYKQSNAVNAIYRKASGGGNYQKKQYGYRR
jgi:hypothetical protein